MKLLDAKHEQVEELSPEETAALLSMSDSFVQETVHMSRHYVGATRHPNVIDATRWKRVARFRHLVMYEERRRQWRHDSRDTSTRKLGSRLADYDVVADDVRLLPATLMVGTFPGDLESVMFGLQSGTEDATRLRASCLGDNNVDERLLAAPLESSDFEDPLHSCTLRWRGLRYGAALASGTIFRSRSTETVYIESTGMTRLDTGERVGYELLQSVAVPDLDGQRRRERKQQAVISFCYVYSQPSPGVVEVFMLGSTSRDGVLLGGALAKMHSLHRLARCAELKKLAWLLHSSNPTLSHSTEGGCCAECDRAFSRWPHRAERQCSACDEHVCASCTAYRHMRFVQPSRRKLTSAKLAFCGRCLQRADETSPVMIAAFEAIEDGKYLTRCHVDTMNSSQPPRSSASNWSKDCLEMDDELVMTILGD